MTMTPLRIFGLAVCLAFGAVAARDAAAYHLETWPTGSVTAGLRDSLLGRAGSADEENVDPLAAYIQIRSALFSGWDDSTGMYVGTQLGRYPQLYRVSAPGGDRRQVTFFSKRMTGFYPNRNPRKKNMLYTQDAEGDEEFRLSLYDLETGRSTRLGGPVGRVGSVFWNDSGTAFAYSHTPKGTDRWDIRIGRSNGQDTLALSLPGTWSPMDFSPEGKYLLLQKYLSAAEAEIHVLDLTSGHLMPLLPPGPKAFLDNGIFIRQPGKQPAKTDASGGAGLFPWTVCFTSDLEGEFIRIYSVRPGSSLAPQPLAPPADWDVEWVNANPERNLLVYSLNEEGLSRLYALDLLAAGHGPAKPKPLAGIPPGIIDGVHFRSQTGQGLGREFAFTVGGAGFPGDAFSYRMDHGKARRWTYSETGGLPAQAFRIPQLVRYPTWDSLPIPLAPPAPPPAPTSQPKIQPRMIPAWYTLPDAKTAPAPLPVLILIHGGPESQARPGFEAFVQYAAGSLGLAVIQPNVRGSSGYGKSWLKADDGYLRMGSVRDIGALLDWIKTRPELDASRVAVAGRSYGGFMALSSLIEYGRQGKKSGRIQAGISTVGISHFPTFLKNTSGYRRDLRRVEYGDERDAKMATFLDRISPLTRLDSLQSPLLLCHGRNDARVPYRESQQIAEALEKKGLPVWLLTFEDEGHAFREVDDQLVHYRVMAGFLSRELGLPTSEPH